MEYYSNQCFIIDFQESGSTTSRLEEVEVSDDGHDVIADAVDWVETLAH